MGVVHEGPNTNAGTNTQSHHNNHQAYRNMNVSGQPQVTELLFYVFYSPN